MRKHSRKVFDSLRTIHNTFLPTQRESSILPNTTAPLSTNSSQWRNLRTEKTFSLSIESHITIFAKVELSRKRVSLLLEQEIVRVSSEGFSLLDYFCFEWMLNYLIGSSSLHEVNGKKMSTAVYAGHLILLAFRDNWEFLYKKNSIHPLLKEFIEEKLGKYSDRKYQGRNSLYQLDKFLLVKIENVNSVFERSQNSVRYSSYCKGYGESGRSVRKQKTRHSYELDRIDTEPVPEEFYSFGKEIHDQEDLFEIEQIILKEKKT